MKIERRYGGGFKDAFREALNDMSYGFNYFPSSRDDMAVIGELVDTDKFDIVPKREYREKLVKDKEEEIKTLETYYQNRKTILLEEKESLIRARDKNKNDKND